MSIAVAFLLIQAACGATESPSAADATAEPTSSAAATAVATAEPEGTDGEGGEEPSGSGGIAEAHMASEVVESADGPDPETYTTTFPSDAPGIYVVYRPEPGSAGTAHLTWLFDGEVQLEGELDIDEDTTWAYGGITPALGGFETGDYELIVELGGDEETLEFTVEPAP